MYYEKALRLVTNLERLDEDSTDDLLCKKCDGEDDPYEIKSVEYLDADNWLQEGTSTKSWQIEENLVLGSPRYNHGMVAVGSCLVVVGGSTFEDPNSSVEVLDTERNIVWKLPELQGYVFGAYNVVAVSTGIISIQVWYDEDEDDPDPISQDSGETLSLVDSNSFCFTRLMALNPGQLKVLRQYAEPSMTLPQSVRDETNEGIEVKATWETGCCCCGGGGGVVLLLFVDAVVVLLQVEPTLVGVDSVLVRLLLVVLTRLSFLLLLLLRRVASRLGCFCGPVSRVCCFCGGVVLVVVLVVGRSCGGCSWSLSSSLLLSLGTTG